ncbi:hypothetical protein HPP92_014567 [Vanilla planifolia]|uniref:GST N-terminal domain-containing protein n=1 Tax=Vanilla planifolia TaxID=51239 RepID=A0A835UX04_VANPL|nr:hypothetical protein HPP92_014567 [Vanilla planifolia]
MRRAQSVYSLLFMPRSIVPPFAAVEACCSVGERKLFANAIASTYSAAEWNRRWWSASSPSASTSSTSVKVGLAGALSFSLAMSTAVVAKERPPPELLPKEVVLYQYEACPFCNKVKAYLDYHDIPYKVVEVNPFGKKEIKWSDYKKVPILVVGGEQLNDSSVIIDELTRRIHVDNSIVDEEEMKWRRWVDEHLVHVLSPNIYRSTSEALESFEYITTHGNFSFTERLTAKYAGAAVMYMVSKKLKKKHGITDERYRFV